MKTKKIIYKGQKVNCNEVQNLLKTNPANQITIHTYNYCGEHLIPRAHGELTKEITYYLESTNETILAQEITIQPFNGDFKLSLDQTINKSIKYLESLVNLPYHGDDEYFDYIPAYIEQVYQLISLIYTTGLFTENEAQEYLHQINQLIEKLNSGSEEESMVSNLDINHSILNTEYLDDTRLHYIAFE